MAATAYAPSQPVSPYITRGATSRTAARVLAASSSDIQRSVFGDIVLLVFLFAQCLDGVLTYVGVVTYGTAIEANPLIATMMAHFGHGLALMGAKTVAGLLGICLHLRQVHLVVGLLAVFYVAVAVIPWVAILF
jgi:uncharacterized membrane protein